jgi:hypothetical protein
MLDRVGVDRIPVQPGHTTKSDMDGPRELCGPRACAGLQPACSRQPAAGTMETCAGWSRHNGSTSRLDPWAWLSRVILAWPAGLMVKREIP